MMLARTLVTCLALAVVLSGAAVPLAAQSDPLERAGVREVQVQLPEGTRIETFRVDATGETGGAPLGLVRWISGPDPEEPDTWRTEVEVSYFAEATRVLTLERVGPERRELVFRELRARSGRTLHLALERDGGAESQLSYGRDVIRTRLAPGPNAALELSLVEVVRRGGAPGGPLDVFQPLANRFETLDVVVRGDGEQRELEFRRAGLVVGEFTFRGDDLVAFRWQAGGPLATRVEEAEYERLRSARRELDEAGEGAAADSPPASPGS